MTILFYLVGIFILVWGLPKIIRLFRRSPGAVGKRIGWKLDKEKGKAYGLYLVNGKIEEREAEDVILDSAS